MESSYPPAMEPISPKVGWPASRRVLGLIGKLAILIAVTIALLRIRAALGWGDSERPNHSHSVVCGVS